MARYKWTKELQKQYEDSIRGEEEVVVEEKSKICTSDLLPEYIKLNQDEFNCSDKKIASDIRKRIEDVRVKMYEQLNSFGNYIISRVNEDIKILEENKMENDHSAKLKIARQQIEDFYKGEFKATEASIVAKFKEVKAKKKELFKIRNIFYRIKMNETFDNNQMQMIDSFSIENYRV